VEIKNYRDLIAWQKAMAFVTSVYRVTAQFPREEIYGLTSQLRRAAVSIPSNIAEGHGRQSTREFVNFLSIAYGSLNETQTQLMIAQQLGYLSELDCNVLLEQSYELARLMNGLSRSLAERLRG